MTDYEPTPALRPTAHQAILAGQSPAIPGQALTETAHVIAVNIDYGDDGEKRSWDVETCRCERAWRHGSAYLSSIAPTSEQP